MRWPRFKVQYPNYDIDIKSNNKQNKQEKYKKITFSNEINIEGNLNTNSNEENILHDDDDDYFESNNNNNNNNKNNNQNDMDYDPFQDARNILDIMGMKTLIPNNPNGDVKSSRDSINYNRDNRDSKPNVNENSYDNTNSGIKNSNVGMEVCILLLLLLYVLFLLLLFFFFLLLLVCML